MSTAPIFEIRFPAYTSGGPPRCTPKSTLTGVVYLHIASALRASCLSLSLMGSERVQMAPESVNHTQTPKVNTSSAKKNTLKKVYFNQGTVLWGDSKLREQGTLSEGIHMFHFSCEFPRVNYPQSHTTSEYEIKYTLKAKLLNTRDARESTVMSTSQPVMYVPETIAPPLPISSEHGDAMARFAFCDNVTEGQQWAYHLRATGMQQAFRPGDTVDLQLRLFGSRTLRKLQFSVIEQTDCFYPQIPEPHEEQLDMGRRLWSSQRILHETADLPFERESCVTPEICSEHMNTKRTRSNQAYYAQLHTQMPKDALVLHETGFLRFTYFVQLNLLLGSSGWGTHSRSTHTRIPLPVATRVLPENATTAILGASATCEQSICGKHRRGSTISAVSGTSCDFAHRVASSSSSMRTDVDDSLELSEYPSCQDDVSGYSSSLKHGRSLADLGARLQQFIPRRMPSAAHANLHSRSRRFDSSQPHSGRAVSHGRMNGHHMWSMADMPPMPAVPAAVASLGTHADAHSSQASLYSSPLARGVSLSTTEGQTTHLLPPTARQQVSSLGLRNQASGDILRSDMSGKEGRFSLTFLLKMREFYHDEANSIALASILNGHDGDGTSVIPNAIRRISSHGQNQVSSGLPLLGLSGRHSNHRQFSLGIGNYSSASLCSSNRRGSRMSVQSQTSMVASNERVRPQLEAVMTSFRNPTTSQVATWSAFGSNRPDSMHYHPAQPASSVVQSTRYSRLSALSVSSNDTACASNGCLTLTKEELPPVPALQNSDLLTM
ncbi:hypothetical protein LPJ78_002800 [Coemansia sp. RSA 989]|nr:hypothetical protein LPJ78_002800 [Coemansia sp. RSA 989]KAJ2673307.1 hypothetical protein IWW42_002317 [Coemansia sp. RSA 1085]